MRAGSTPSQRLRFRLLAKRASRQLPPARLFGRSPPDFRDVTEGPVALDEDESIDTAFIDPGRPWENGTDESFNGTFRDECLRMEWFRNRTEAAVVIETWRRHYNDVRPHSSLDYRTPSEFKKDLKRKYTDQRSTRREPTFQESVVQ